VLVALILAIIGVFVFLIFQGISKAYASGEVALKAAIARDISLLIDTIYAYPYDMQITYNEDLSNFVVEILQGNVNIHSASYVAVSRGQLQGSDLTSARYSFAPLNDNPGFILDKPAKMVFQKQSGKLTITP